MSATKLMVSSALTATSLGAVAREGYEKHPFLLESVATTRTRTCVSLFGSSATTASREVAERGD